MLLVRFASYVTSIAFTVMKFITTLSENTEPVLIESVALLMVIADVVLNPSGLPTKRPLSLPEPESRRRLTDFNFTSTFVYFGPKLSTARFTAPSRKRLIDRRASARSRTSAIAMRRMSFFTQDKFLTFS